MHKSLLLLLGFILSGVSAHGSVAFLFNVTGANTLYYSFSGTIDAPVLPDNEGYILLVDITGPVQADYIDISGTGRIASANGLNLVYSGYNSLVYNKPLQLRFENYIQDGQPVSGSGTITFNVPHQLTNSMFVDGVTGIYLGTSGTSPNFTKGPFQGYASAVPEPSTYAAFLGLGALALAFFRRCRK